MIALDATTDSGAYILGVLWALCSENQEGYYIRHRDPWYSETVRDYLGLEMSVQSSYSRTGPQARLKVAGAEDIAFIREILAFRGWTPRQAAQRPYPSGSVNDRGFVRAWVEIHSTSDIARTGRRRQETPRLRVYGNWDLLAEINAVIAVGARVSPRKLQKTVNEITKALYFTGASYVAVVEWLYEDCGMSNPVARARLEEFI